MESLPSSMWRLWCKLTYHKQTARDATPEIARQVLAALARVNVTTADNSRVVADVQSRYGDISRQTVASYITALRRVFVIEEIPQWFTE